MRTVEVNPSPSDPSIMTVAEMKAEIVRLRGHILTSAIEFDHRAAEKWAKQQGESAVSYENAARHLRDVLSGQVHDSISPATGTPLSADDSEFLRIQRTCVGEPDTEALLAIVGKLQAHNARLSTALSTMADQAGYTHQTSSHSYDAGREDAFRAAAEYVLGAMGGGDE